MSSQSPKQVSQDFPNQFPRQFASEFIVYACPLGELAKQLHTYFEHSLKLCGCNAAHHYMPHCSLTGFFQDEEALIPLYVKAIDRALEQASPWPDPVIMITGMSFRPDWHGLELQSDWLRHLIAKFAQLTVSWTHQHPLRLKDWLHLSLAYEFPSEQFDRLMQLAQTYVNPQAPVEWELRFYQRHVNHTWTCHRAWPLTTNPESSEQTNLL
jgi:ubiquitin-associated SH3 domain-containing protein